MRIRIQDIAICGMLSLLTACGASKLQESQRILLSKPTDIVGTTLQPQLSSLEIIDLKTGNVIASDVSSGSSYSISNISAQCLSVRATGNSAVSSVKFALDDNNSFAIENTAPFDLMGSDGTLGCLNLGSHSIVATPFTSDHATGAAGTAVSRTFSLVQSSADVAQITGLELLDQKTGQILVTSLVDFSTVQVSDLGQKCLDVRAIVAPGVIGSVEFGLNTQASFSVENTAPFNLMGDKGVRGCLTSGSQILVSTPYSLSNRGGIKGAPFSRSITLVNVSSGTPTPTATPKISATPVSSPTPTATPIVAGTMQSYIEESTSGTTSAKHFTYYFSSSTGDDSRSADDARDPATPWKSLNKLNQMLLSSNSTIVAGDTLALKRGEVFNGSIEVTGKSGSATGGPITIGAYGSGLRPQINTMIPVTGWKANLKYPGVYDAVNNSLGDNVQIVMINGKLQELGRYPNTDAADGGYLYFESFDGVLSITDNQLPATPNWTGAEVVIRPAHWLLNSKPITNHSGNKITYGGGGNVPIGSNYGYFIQRHLKTLDRTGEWYYQPSTHTLSVFFGSGGPGAAVVEASSKDVGISLVSSNYFRLDHLAVRGANDRGIYTDQCDDLVLQNLRVQYSGADGMFIDHADYPLVESNAVLDSYNDGINISSALKPVIRSNLVQNTYTVAGRGGSGNGKGWAVRAGATDSLIEGNRVINSGFNAFGIGGDRSILRYNYVDTYCFVKDDCGGFYTFAGKTGVVNVGRKIVNNIILNGVGTPQGTDTKTGHAASGVYLDDNSNGVEIASNVIAGNAFNGVFIHNSQTINIHDNLLFNNANQIFAKHDSLGSPLRSDQVVNNSMETRNAKQVMLYIGTSSDDVASFGTVDRNIYSSPYNEGGANLQAVYKPTSSTSTISRYFDLSAWRTLYPYDSSSHGDIVPFIPFTVQATVGTNKFAAGAFDTKVAGFGSKTVLSWENAGKLDGGYLKSVPSAPGALVVFNVGVLSKAKKYRVRLSAKAASTIGLGVYLRNATYSPISPIVRNSVGTARKDIEYVFVPEADETNGSLVVTADMQVVHYLDNVSVQEVDATMADPDTAIKFLYNDTRVPKSYTLSGSWVDAKGNAYSGSLSLAPFAGVVLHKR